MTHGPDDVTERTSPRGAEALALLDEAGLQAQVIRALGPSPADGDRGPGRRRAVRRGPVGGVPVEHDAREPRAGPAALADGGRPQGARLRHIEGVALGET